jgi:hypothetical protein
MRALQFWILLLGSSFVSVLFIKQIFLSRDLNQAQRVLVDNQQTASGGPTYENLWKQLALHIYQASRQDPALAAVLKSEKVEIHSGAPAGTTTPTPPASAPSASSKAPVAPLPPPAP